MVKVTDWHDLWLYSVDMSDYSDEVSGFMQDCQDDYEQLTPCSKCSSRRQETMDIKGQASGQVLAQRIVCRSCGTIIGETDKRDELRKKLERGEVLVKDKELIERDLG